MLNQQTVAPIFNSAISPAGGALPPPSAWPAEAPYDASETKPEPMHSGKALLVCEVCGNEYDKAFTVTRGNEQHVFDSFECAIHALAPTCTHCACKVVGHGVEQNGDIYCCASCARHAGITCLQDRC